MILHAFNLRDWRAIHGMTQAQAAEFFGASVRSISTWETAGEVPDWILAKATEEPITLASAFAQAEEAMRKLGAAIAREK